MLLSKIAVSRGVAQPRRLDRAFTSPLTPFIAAAMGTSFAFHVSSSTS
jgi:hypothetical protein